MKREYTYIAMFVIAIAVLLSISPMINENAGLGWKTALSFMLGSIVSAIAGYIGMSIATRSNARTAQGAVSGGLKGALSVAISGGAVMGLSVVGLSLLGLCIVYVVAKADPNIVNGYAMGASLVALFARCGGRYLYKRRRHGC